MIVNLDWNDIDAYMDSICCKLKDKLGDNHIHKIVGIVRGGLIPATLLSYKLQASVMSLQWQTRNLNKEQSIDDVSRIYEKVRVKRQKGGSLLIVDDIVDSGKTMKQMYELFSDLEKTFDIPVYYASIVKFDDVKFDFDLICGNSSLRCEWVSFPWDD